MQNFENEKDYRNLTSTSVWCKPKNKCQPVCEILYANERFDLNFAVLSPIAKTKTTKPLLDFTLHLHKVVFLHHWPAQATLVLIVYRTNSSS